MQQDVARPVAPDFRRESRLRVDETSGPTAPDPPRCSTPTHESSVSSALSEAVKSHVDTLSPRERDAFENAQHSLTDQNLLRKVSAADKAHADRSILRKGAINLELTLGIIKKLTELVSAVASANPVATIVIGTVRLVFDVALGFLSYFTKLSDMIRRFAGILEVLTEWTETPENVVTVHKARVRVYRDFLSFCQRAYAVFVDRRGQTRRWATVSTFVRIQWKPFEDEYASNILDLEHHLVELELASFGALLTAAADAQKHRQGKIAENPRL